MINIENMSKEDRERYAMYLDDQRARWARLACKVCGAVIEKEFTHATWCRVAPWNVTNTEKKAG